MMNEAELKYWQNWKPSDYDIKWTQRLIDTLKDGGMWMVPKSQNVFRFDKGMKIATLTEGGVDSLFYQIKKVLEILGWTVVMRPAVALDTGAGKTQAGAVPVSDPNLERALGEAFEKIFGPGEVLGFRGEIEPPWRN
jgi:hypothetical protein